MTWIGVVDCNNFFVSCERLFRPDLQNKPVAVLSSNDGCFVARSQEVKDMGIPMGVPYFKVKDIVKDNQITLFSSHFTLYRDVSRRVFEVMREVLDEVEQYSIDEAFFKINDDNPERVARLVKDEIERKVGVPVSVGIAASKTQAKYAVEQAKKTGGIAVLSPTAWSKEVNNTKLSELWGVGGRLNVRYQKAGYDTVADLLQADETRIKRLFGIGGLRLKTELHGKIAYHVENKVTQQKSMMSSRSFKKPSTNMAVLEDAVAYHTRHIATDLRRQAVKVGVLRVSIQASRFSDFFLQGASSEAVLDVPTNDTFTLLEIAQKLLKEAYKQAVPYKKVGVSVGHIQATEAVQDTLFADDLQTKNDDLLALVDGLNKKADRELISLGDRRRGAHWQARKELISPSYTTKWTDVANVKA